MKEITTAKKEVYNFTMQVSTWFYTIEASFRTAPTKKFAPQAKKNLIGVRLVPFLIVRISKVFTNEIGI
jgi:hypothetical protein